jgi:hypothetical protein
LAARTDCESITAAVGVVFRPAAVRAASRNWSWTCCKVPLSRQAAK